jgi:hypothetical protein
MGERRLAAYFEAKAHGKACCRKGGGAFYVRLEKCRECESRRGCKQRFEALDKLSVQERRSLEG